MKSIKLTIGNRTISAYSDGIEYFYSLTGMAKLVGKDDISSRRFLEKIGYIARNVTLSATDKNQNPNIKAVPSQIVTAYLADQTGKGSPEALELLVALAAESLDIRASKSFGELTEVKLETIQEETANFLEHWKQVREMTKHAHAAMATAIKYKSHPGHLVHDLMTSEIFGDTAESARALDLIDGDVTIGLNHQPSIEKLEHLARAKKKYSYLQKGDWREQTLRAVESTR